MTKKKTRPCTINALRKRAEEKLRSAESKPQKALSPEQARHILHDLHVHQIELEMQNEELRRAHMELEASRERYFDLYNLAPVGYFTLNERGLIQEANLTASKMLGVERDGLVKQLLSRFVLPEDQDIYYKHRRQLMNTGSPQVCELRLKKKDRAPFWTRIEETVVKDACGSTVCRAVISDIAERKAVEETLSFVARCGLTADEDFFQALARYLGETLGMDFVCVDRLVGDGLTAQTQAIFVNGKFEDNVAYALKDTPCGDVVGKTVCCFPAGVRHLFPKDAVLQDMAAESYVGVTLWGHTGKPIGLIAIIGRRPLANPQLAESMLKLVAVRTAGELERRQAEETLDRAYGKLEWRVRERTAELQGAYAELYESEERFRQMSENVREVFWLSDADLAKVHYVSPAFKEIWGRSHKELFNNAWVWEDAVHPDDKERVFQAFLSIRECGVPISCEYRIVRPDGSVRWIHDHGSPVRDADGKVYRLAGVARDITERKQTQAALNRLQEELLKISEREKQIIAQELHDGLCQHLSGTAMMGSLLHRRLEAAGSPEAENAKQIGDLLKTGVDEARNLSHGLHPVRQGSEGLKEALLQYAKTATNLFHIRCAFRCGKSVKVESQAVATHMFRITQEAVNNAMKHGQASRVLITLQKNRKKITLSIRDNGIGIPRDLPASKGMGMQIMNHRAATIGAEVTIRRAGKRGTVVSCTLPC